MRAAGASRGHVSFVRPARSRAALGRHAALDGHFLSRRAALAGRFRQG